MTQDRRNASVDIGTYVKRLLIHGLVQFFVVIIVGSVAGFIAIVAMGGIGGVAMGVAPAYSFGLVADIVCPGGSLEYYSVQRSYHAPGESEPHLECVSTAGEREDVLLQGIVTVLALAFGGVFGVVFVPGWVVLAIAGWFVTYRVIKASWGR